MKKALWISENDELIKAAELAVAKNLSAVSCPPESVGTLYSWLGAGIEIIARFDFCEIRRLSEQINSALKKGAAAAQIFVSVATIPQFISDLLPVKMDLFFNKKLFVGLNLAEIRPLDWPDIFFQLNKLGAEGLLSIGLDSVGKFYGALDNWDFGGELQIRSQSAERIEQSLDLINKMRPELLQNATVFV